MHCNLFNISLWQIFNSNALSFSSVDSSKFKFEKEDKIRPFFETLDYWGIQRKRVRMICNGCGKVVGYVYDDGPPLTDGPGQFHFGPSQVIPRAPRYTLKIKALKIVPVVTSIEGVLVGGYAAVRGGYAAVRGGLAGRNLLGW